MSPPASRPRTRPLWPALALVLALPAAASAQDAPSAPAPAAAEGQKQPPPVHAIPLEDVGSRAESVGTLLQSFLPSEESTEALRNLETQLAHLEKEVAQTVFEIDKNLEDEPAVTRLQEIEKELVALLARLSTPDQQLDKDLRKVSESLDRVDAIAPVWELTQAAAREAHAAKTTLQVIESQRTRIGQVRRELVARRNEILTQRDGLLEPKASIDRSLARVRGGINARLEGVFSIDAPPLWHEHIRSALRADFAEGWQDKLLDRAGRTIDYIVAQRQLLLFQLALFAAIAIGLRSVRARANARAVENYDLREAGRVFDFPNSMALVISLTLSPQLHPAAPHRFGQLVFMLAVIPAVLIVRRLAPRSMTPVVVATPLFFLVDRICEFVDTMPTVERFLLLFEYAAALGFLLWLMWPSRFARIPAEAVRSPFLRVVATALRVAIALLAVAIVASIVGFQDLGSILGSGTLTAGYWALVVYALKIALEGVGVYALVLWPLRLVRGISRHRQLVRQRIETTVHVIAVLVWIGVTLSVYGIDDLVRNGLSGVLNAALSVGALSVSLADVLVFGGTLWLSFLLVRFVNFILQEDVFPRVRLARGVPYAVSSLVRYSVIFFGFMIALAAAGIELSKLTVIAGGLGVGIGFGLQNVVNNFVSGLILLFERPVQTGDTVHVQSQNLWGEIKSIGIRASVIRTWDGAEVIVPNGQLISDSVTNWTLSDRRRRIEVNVGVEYGTDAQRVIDLLVQVASSHERVLRDPEPSAFFLSFGESSLDFLVRCWIPDFNEGYAVRSQLAVGIQRALAEAGIGVPFPQRDLHVRSVSPEATAAAAKLGLAATSAAASPLVGRRAGGPER